MRTSQSILACLLLVPTIATAEQRQFGNSVYSPPPGWISGNDSDGKLVFLSDLPNDLCEFCYINLSASQPGRGSLEMYLNREKLRFVDPDDRESTKVVGDQTLVSLAGHQAAMQGLKVDGNIQVVIALSLGDRFELFGFQGDARDEETLAESMSVFQNQVLPFFDKMTFVSAGAAPVLPAPRPGDLDGVWWGWSTSTVFGLDMMMQQRMDYRTLIFWPNGYFFDGTPPEGLAKINPDALQEMANPDYGVYLKSGSKLTLTFATGEVEELTPNGEDWDDGQKTLSKVEPIADGTALVGATSSFFYSGFTPGSGVAGGVSSSSSTEFFADGTYTGENFGGAFGNFDGGGGFATSNNGATGGTYTVRDGLVISTPSDGAPPTAALALRVGDDILIGNEFLEVSK